MNAISLDVIDTTSLSKVETKRPIMKEVPKWLEHDVDVLEEESKDDPLPGETDLEEDIESVSQSPPPQRKAIRGSIENNPLQLPPQAQELHLPPQARPKHFQTLLLEEERQR
jgi:hypothetical protein